MNTWKNTINLVVEVEEKGIHIIDYASSTYDIVGKPMVNNEEELESSKEIKIRKIHNLLIHKIGSLKHSS